MKAEFIWIQTQIQFELVPKKSPHATAHDDIFNKSNAYSVSGHSRRDPGKLAPSRRVFNVPISMKKSPSDGHRNSKRREDKASSMDVSPYE
jgi:hypothetical protein